MARIEVLRKSTVEGPINIKSRIRKNKMENMEEELFWKREEKLEMQTAMTGIKRF